MGAFFTIEVNASDVVEGLKAVPEVIQIANTAAVARIREDLRGIILGSLEFAFDEAGPGFPEIYRQHLRIGVLQISHPTVISTADGIIVQVYGIEESLGTYEQLAEGFHYHAILNVLNDQFSVSHPQVVELPYLGEELENPFEERYRFWLAVVGGEDFKVTFGGGTDKRGKPTPKHSKTISTAGLYEQTLAARVAYWGNTYPEWLVLEYGTEFEPVVPPTHFSGLLDDRLENYLDEVYAEIIESVLEVWDEPEVRLNVAGRLINAKTGQFVPYLPDSRGTKDNNANNS